MFKLIALGTAKTLCSFGRSECNRVKLNNSIHTRYRSSLLDPLKHLNCEVQLK